MPPLTNFGQGSRCSPGLRILSRKGRGRFAASPYALAMSGLWRGGAASLPLPLRERIRRPGEQSEPLADVGEGFRPSTKCSKKSLSLIPTPKTRATISPVPQRLQRMAMRRGGTGAGDGEEGRKPPHHGPRRKWSSSELKKAPACL